MTRISYLLLLPVAAVSMGFTFPWSPTIEGNWSCTFEGPSMNGTFDIQYIDGGESNSNGKVTMTDTGGVTIEMGVTMNSNWRVKGDNLIETATSGAILSLKVAGTSMSPKQVPKEIREVLFSGSTAFKIVELTKNKLKLAGQPSGMTECDRKN
jgi:hypothetical protein